jgi:hypothetical protein
MNVPVSWLTIKSVIFLWHKMEKWFEFVLSVTWQQLIFISMKQGDVLSQISQRLQ